jgi:hypothetical protein
MVSAAKLLEPSPRTKFHRGQSFIAADTACLGVSDSLRFSSSATEADPNLANAQDKDLNDRYYAAAIDLSQGKCHFPVISVIGFRGHALLNLEA